MTKKTSAQPEIADTLISRDIRVKGNISSDNDIWIDGTIEGDINSKGSVTIGEGGTVEGNVRAHRLYVSGSVHGDINAEETTTCYETAHIIGDINTTNLAVENGATIVGSLTMPRRDHYDDEE